MFEKSTHFKQVCQLPLSLIVAFPFVMPCLCFIAFTVFPYLGNYMYNGYKIENKLSLLRVESRIKFHNLLKSDFSIILHGHTAVTQHCMVYNLITILPDISPPI